MSMQSINPATGETLVTFDTLTPEQVEAKLALAQQTFQTYRLTTLEERAGWLSRAAELLEEQVEALARTATLEMGKTLEAARQEVRKCASACRYYAEHGPRFLQDEPVQTEADAAYVTHQPLGVVLAVMPWNFPYWQVFRFLCPALMAGNVGLLKHASNVPQCALAIERVLLEAGFPQGAFQTLLVGSADVETLLKDARVRAVSLTGSEAAGRSVAGTAGRELKPAVMELGGSDPFIVMPSADLDLAVRTAVTARTINNGQSCIAAKRFIVHTAVYADFEARFTAALAALKLGDPMDEETDVGPLATPKIREELHAQVRDAVQKGARLLTGGTLPDGEGNYYPVTALAGLTPEMGVWREEVFGPVALLFEAQDLDHAIELANGTTFGLGSSAWTNDEAERARFIRDIEAGSVFINSMVASDPRLPFGGVKASGFGRELSHHGLMEFVNVKTVSVGAPSGAHHTRTE